MLGGWEHTKILWHNFVHWIEQALGFFEVSFTQWRYCPLYAMYIVALEIAWVTEVKLWNPYNTDEKEENLGEGVGLGNSS